MNESPAFECAQMSIRAAFVITVEPICATFISDHFP